MPHSSQAAPEPQPDPSVAVALRAMGLDSGQLRAAVLAGHDLAARFTPNDVATRAGFNRWAETMRYLGDAYVPKGFSRERPGGFEVLRSPDGSYDIAVAPGNPATGLPDRMPSTRVERGPLTGQAVAGNRDQLRFDSNVVPYGANEPRLDEQTGSWTWLLLHYHDEWAEELRSELSAPIEFAVKNESTSQRGLVTRFKPRLILPAIPLSDSAEGEDDEDGNQVLTRGGLDVPRRSTPT